MAWETLTAWGNDCGQSALFLAAPKMVLNAMSTIPSTSATPLLLRVLGAVQLMAAAATWVLKVRRPPSLRLTHV